jgi:hypothetical protein
MQTHELQEGQYPLVLVNAVQYQCSLGVAPQAHRTEIFQQCWDSFGRDDYLTRITNLYQPGDIVINSCTGDGLRKVVQKALTEAITQAEQATSTAKPMSDSRTAAIIKLVHPCNWERIAARDGRFE